MSIFMSSWEIMPVLWRSFVHIQRHLPKLNAYDVHCLRCLSTRTGTIDANSSPSTNDKPVPTSLKAEKISMAMKAYLERAKAHENFMEKEISEYEIGKRHLANIMGADPDNFTQEDIDQAIQYLLPSSLYDKKSRPLMKHPSEVVPQKKSAQFGTDGRPYHAMYYTGHPNYYNVMHDLANCFEELKIVEDDMKSKGITSLQKLNLGGSQWVDKHILEKMLEEILSDKQYYGMLILLDRLALHPWSHRYKDLIFKYRKMMPTQSKIQDIPEPKFSESGRPYQEAEGRRKEAQAKVVVWDQGTGDVSINGQDLLTYFPHITDREQIMFPLQFTNKLGKVDFEARVESGGSSGQAGALRLALSNALTSLVDRDMIEKMRLAGLLTLDPRRRERKKFGQEGARRKFTWKKR